MHLNLKNKILVIIGLVIIGIISISCFILYPAIKKIYDLKLTIENTERQMESDYQKTRLLKRSIRELHNIENDITKFSNITIAQGDELKVITELEKAAEDNHVSQDLSVVFVAKDSIPKEEKNKDPYYLLTFKTTANFADLLNYLRTIEKLPYYIIIEQLNFTKDYKNQKDQLIGLNFFGKIYSPE